MATYTNPRTGETFSYKPGSDQPSETTLELAFEEFAAGTRTAESLYTLMRNAGYNAETANQIIQRETAKKGEGASPGAAAGVGAGGVVDPLAGVRAVPVTLPFGGDLFGNQPVGSFELTKGFPTKGRPFGKSNAFQTGIAHIADQRRELPLADPFRAYLNQQVPSMTSGPFREYLEEQSEPLQSLYRLGQQFRDLPDPISFYDYLGGIGGIQRPNPSAFGAYARRGAAAITGGRTDLNAQLFDPETGVLGTPERQFNLAVAGAQPELAREFRPGFARQARKAFEQFRYDQPGEDFLPYVINRGYNFFR